MTNPSTQFWQTAALFCTLAVLASMPSYASESSKLGNAAESPNEQEVANNKTKRQKNVRNKKICKRVKVTGTHFRKRLCNTQAGWRELQNQSQEAMRELSRGRSTAN